LSFAATLVGGLGEDKGTVTDAAGELGADTSPSLSTAVSVKLCTPGDKTSVVNVFTPDATEAIGVLGVGEAESNTLMWNVSGAMSAPSERVVGSIHVIVAVCAIGSPKPSDQPLDQPKRATPGVRLTPRAEL
jgi:hypothetical protein